MKMKTLDSHPGTDLSKKPPPIRKSAPGLKANLRQARGGTRLPGRRAAVAAGWLRQAHRRKLGRIGNGGPVAVARHEPHQYLQHSPTSKADYALSGRSGCRQTRSQR